jgi:hypothetical protein
MLGWFGASVQLEKSIGIDFACYFLKVSCRPFATKKNGNISTISLSERIFSGESVI